MQKKKKNKNTTKSERIFSSNAIRLTGKELLLTAIIAALIILFAIPLLWHKAEKVTLTKNFRLAYDYRDDYWAYKQVSAAVTKKYPVIFIGDSVIWGMYVDDAHTLTSIINKKLAQPVAGNLAIDGLHSAAMEGLIRYYGTTIEDKTVFIYFNPLWMNSKKYDLSATEKMEVHHPRLVAQFSRSLKCYQEPLATRMGVLLERNCPFFSLLNHIRLSFFENENFGQWILDNPYENPLAKLSFNLEAQEKDHPNSSRDWSQSGITKQDWHWVELKDSTQWAAFKNIISLLQSRNNRVCVMVGSINPYIMTDKSLQQYDSIIKGIVTWLKSNKIDYIKMPELPSSDYADASHPLDKGYNIMADAILKSPLMKPYVEKAKTFPNRIGNNQKNSEDMVEPPSGCYCGG
jgi:hypothetical protein